MFSNNELLIPPAPSAPSVSLAPPAPPFPGTSGQSGLNFRGDPKIKGILQKYQNEPEVMQKALSSYQVELKTELKTCNKGISFLEEKNAAREKECQEIDISYAEKQQAIVEMQAKIELLLQLTNLSSEKVHATRTIFLNAIQKVKDGLTELSERKTLLKKQIEVDVANILKMREESNCIKNKQREVEKALLPYKKTQQTPRVGKTATARTPYENALCQQAEIFIRIRPNKRSQAVVYTEKEILALEIALLTEQELADTDRDFILEQLLIMAIQWGRNDTPLGSAPRQKIAEILGTDIITTYNKRQEEKRAKEEQAKQELKALREAESAQKTQETALKSGEKRPHQEGDPGTPRKKARGLTEGSSPSKLANLQAELEIKQKMIAEAKKAKEHAEQEARQAKELAEQEALRAREEARRAELAEQRANMEREEKSRMEAELLKIQAANQLTIPTLKPPLITGQRRVLAKKRW